MPANTNAITIDASNAPIELPPVVVTAPVKGNNPGHIIKPISGGAGGELLVYPGDRPKSFLSSISTNIDAKTF
jgi:hypothetical protein